MTVVDAKYDEYALIHTLKTKGDDVYSVTKLYGKVMCETILSHVNSVLLTCRLTGRSPDLGAEVMAKFKQISLESGILPDNIVFLPKNGKLPSFRNLVENKCDF